MGLHVRAHRNGDVQLGMHVDQWAIEHPNYSSNINTIVRWIFGPWGASFSNFAQVQRHLQVMVRSWNIGTTAHFNYQSSVALPYPQTFSSQASPHCSS